MFLRFVRSSAKVAPFGFQREGAMRKSGWQVALPLAALFSLTGCFGGDSEEFTSLCMDYCDRYEVCTPKAVSSCNTTCLANAEVAADLDSDGCAEYLKEDLRCAVQLSCDQMDCSQCDENGCTCLHPSCDTFGAHRECI